LRCGPSRAFSNEIVNFRHWITDDVIVTRTFVDRGNSLSVSLQCRYHRCRFMLTASKCPDRMALREWAKSAVDLGKGSAHKEAHMSEMRRMIA
jgi:hypothetical protein